MRNWRVLVVGLPLFLALATPSVAEAHAVLVSSSPHQGEVLGTAPGVVTLRFSEPLEPQASSATVTDPAGSSFKSKVTDQTIVIPVTTNVPGTYQVTWRSVSADDGHTESGSFRFSVQSGGGGASSTTGSAGGAGVALLRWIEYLALLLAIGAIFIRSRARRDPPLDWVQSPVSVVIGVLLVAGLSVALADALVSSGSPSVHSVTAYLTSGRPGVARLLVVAGALVALIACLARWWVWPWLLGTVIALAASGHAAAVDPPWWGISVDAVHLLAASIWAGGILALALLRPTGGWSGEQARRLLDRFSPVAIAAFLLTVGFGFIQALQDVGSLSALLNSSYGRTLVVKVLAVATMVPLSFLAWRRRVAPRGEALIAVFVIGASALLSSSPLPPPPERGHAAPSHSVVSALPQPGDLTLGSHAGQVLVGLTLQPGDPGTNQALVYLQPIEGDPAGLNATLEVNGDPAALSVCGPNCRQGTVDLSGGEQVSIHVAGPTGGTGQFRLPALPATPDPALLEMAQQRMHALRTYRLREVLNSGLAAITSRYEFQAPDRMESRSHGTSIVLIGGTRYIRQSSGGRWQVQPGGSPLQVPSFIWDFFKPLIDVRVLGSQRVGGIQTKVIAFYGNNGGIPVWFRLWIDDRGFVHQAHMRAVGHFMDHRYFAFNAPIRITSPTGADASGP